MHHAIGPVLAVFLALLCLSSVGGEAAPADSEEELVRQRRAAAEEFWDELTEGRGKAESHEHWERIVRRSARWNSPYYVDDTQHIVNVQEYYREALGTGWSDERGTELARLMQESDLWGPVNARIQNQGQMPGAKDEQKRIPGRYIVMLNSEATEQVLDRTIALLQQAHVESDGVIRTDHVTPMKHLVLGFTATMGSKAVELMQKHPYLDVLEVDTALKRAAASFYVNNQARAQESSVPWNLDRLDQHNKELDGRFLPQGLGEGAHIYIIDTGIRYDHKEFADLEGRSRALYSDYDAIDKLTGSDLKGQDCHGHGTHCAGTAAGNTYGVAKGATVYSMRALGCDGTGAVSGIVEAMNIIAEKVHDGPVVFSMSLGVRESPSLNVAVKRAMEKGIAAVGAAGNQAGNSCFYSPASARIGIAVGATDKNDNSLYFSNAGECTDVYAPGESIESASIDCDTCTKTLSGTSMAAPHVAGYMAVILSLYPEMNAMQAKDHMIKVATKDIVGLARISTLLASETPNRFLYMPQARDQNSDLQSMAYISSIENTNGRP